MMKFVASRGYGDALSDGPRHVDLLTLGLFSFPRHRLRIWPRIACRPNSSHDLFFHSGMCWAFHIADKLQKLGNSTISSGLRIIDLMSSLVWHGKPSLRPLSHPNHVDRYSSDLLSAASTAFALSSDLGVNLGWKPWGGFVNPLRYPVSQLRSGISPF